MRRFLMTTALMGLLLGVADQARAAVVVEFGEVDLPSLTDLTGSDAFAAFGLAFEDSFYAIDERFIGAGIDDRGITTSSENIGAVIFTTPVSSLTVDTVRLSTDIFLTVFDSGGNVLDTQSALGGGSPEYTSFTFSGVGLIARLEFHDSTQQVGIGRLEYDQAAAVPEPSTIALAGLGGLGLVGIARRRRWA